MVETARTYVLPAKEHAARIRCILKFIQNEPSLRLHVPTKLEEYLEKLAEKCEKGDFEELGDVAIFAYVGKKDQRCIMASSLLLAPRA
jgi:hypothetical protein